MKKLTEKRKKNIVRVIMLILAVCMIMSFVLLPMGQSIYAEEDDSVVIVTEFETGGLAQAIEVAKDGTDLNVITKISVSGGTLDASDFSAICGYPNIQFLELAGCEVKDGVIPENALASRNQLSYVSLPCNTETIGTRAFAGNRALLKISIPVTLRNIGDYAFEGCEKVEDFSIPAELETLGTGAFSDCKALGAFALPVGITEVPAYCFSKASITELHLGPQVTSIGDGAFSDCHDLADIYFYGETAFSAPESAFQNLKVTIHTYEGGEGFEALDSNFVDIAYDLSEDSVYTPPQPSETAQPVQTEKPVEAAEEKSEETVAEVSEADKTEASSEAAPAEKEEGTEAASQQTSAPSHGGFSGVSVLIIAVLCAVVGVLAALLVVKSKKN